MPVISQPIPPASFELVRERIYEILLDEYAHQCALNYENETVSDVRIMLERYNPMSHDELPALNVCLARGDYDNEKAMVQDGTYMYHIDCYTKTNATEDSIGDTDAMRALHRMMSLVRGIFKNPVYALLGFVAGQIIVNVRVPSLGPADPAKYDFKNFVMGRVELEVRMIELDPGIVPRLAEGQTTRIAFLNGTGFNYNLEL